MPTGDAYSSGHLVPSLWDLHMFYLLRPILFRTCHYFSGLCFPNIPRYFLDFALGVNTIGNIMFCIAFFDINQFAKIGKFSNRTKTITDSIRVTTVYKKRNVFTPVRKYQLHVPIMKRTLECKNRSKFSRLCLNASKEFLFHVLSSLLSQGRRRRGAGGHVCPPLSKVGGGAQVGLSPPPPLLGRANVLISLFAHIFG